MNMESIIVAVDFSKVSVNAARYAAEMANFYNAGCGFIIATSCLLPIRDWLSFVSAAELQNVAEFEMQELVKELSGIPDKLLQLKER
jgi:hypothetical protein